MPTSWRFILKKVFHAFSNISVSIPVVSPCSVLDIRPPYNISESVILGVRLSEYVYNGFQVSVDALPFPKFISICIRYIVSAHLAQQLPTFMVLLFTLYPLLLCSRSFAYLVNIITSSPSKFKTLKTLPRVFHSVLRYFSRPWLNCFLTKLADFRHPLCHEKQICLFVLSRFSNENSARN